MSRSEGRAFGAERGVKSLRVLLVEDSEVDADLLLHLLRRGGFQAEWRRVISADEMRSALRDGKWDLVLSDYNLPQFSAPEALQVLKESGLDLPFIVVSGAIGEKTAVESMKSGAHDYLMKENLARLVPAIERELREAVNRAGKRKAAAALEESELRYRLLWETAPDAILFIAPDGTIQQGNPAVRQVFGYEPDDLAGKHFSLLQTQEVAGTPFSQAPLRPGRLVETMGRRKDGSSIPVEVVYSDMRLWGERVFVAFVRDVSKRYQAEEELRHNQEQFRVAREIQQHLFPEEAPRIPNFEIAGTSQPAEATGGDYFDYLPMQKDNLGVVIGDVTGHGFGPALLMAETRAYLRILARNHDDAGEILTRANVVLAEDLGSERFITLLLLKLDPRARTVSYANAGHPPAYVIDVRGEVRALLKRTEAPLGIRPDAQYVTAPPLTLKPGEVLLLLTDGFEEAVSADNQVFGTERLLELVRKHQRNAAREIVQRILGEMRLFLRGEPQEDDLTVIVIKAVS